MSKILRADPYLTRIDTDGDQGRQPAVQYYEKQAGSDGASGNTIFTLGSNYSPGSNTLVVFVNGQKAELLATATDETEYEETDSTTVTFGAALLDADVVEFMVVGTYFIQDTSLYLARNEQRNRNVIINGDFNIWQRGISDTGVTGDAFTADRFKLGVSSDATFDWQRTLQRPTQAESGHNSNYGWLVTATTGDASIAAAQYARVQYRVEGYDLRYLSGKVCTLSFWVKATVTGTYCVSLRSGGGDRSFVHEYTMVGSDTWQKVSLTFTMDDSLGTWDYTNGHGVQLFFVMAAGSNYQTASPEQWNADALFATANQVNGIGSASDKFALSQVQLELGDTATPFQLRLYEDELALCQRYYEKSYNPETAPATATTVGRVMKLNPAAVIDFAMCNFAVTKRTTPTVVVYSPNNGATGNVYDYTSTSNRAATVTAPGSHHSGIFWTAGGVNQVGFHWSADAEL